MSTCFFSFDVEDWFQVENLRAAYPMSVWEQIPRRVVGSTRVILDVLAEVEIPATFFILGWVAEREPELVEEVIGGGHEVASHGYGHGLPLEMGLGDFREDVKRSKTLLQALSGRPVIGYRAPSFNLDNSRLDVLAELGFEFDSSYHPFAAHHRYHRFDVGPPVAPGLSRLANGMFEFGLPIGSLGPVRVPVSGGGYFRLYPGLLFRALFRQAQGRYGAVSMYLHSWEFDPCQPLSTSVTCVNRFRHYTGLGKTLPRFRSLVETLNDTGARFTTMGSYLRETRLNAR